MVVDCTQTEGPGEIKEGMLKALYTDELSPVVVLVSHHFETNCSKT